MDPSHTNTVILPTNHPKIHLFLLTKELPVVNNTIEDEYLIPISPATEMIPERTTSEVDNSITDPFPVNFLVTFLSFPFLSFSFKDTKKTKQNKKRWTLSQPSINGVSFPSRQIKTAAGMTSMGKWPSPFLCQIL